MVTNSVWMSKISEDSLFEDTGLGDTLVEEQEQEIVEQIDKEQQIIIAEDKAAILAFKLLRRANITKEEKMLILT